MENYLKAVSEMYSQFEKGEVHPMQKYIGRRASIFGEEVEVVGYRDFEDTYPLIVEASKIGGWYEELLDSQDVVVKKCERYWYASINDLID